MINKLKVLANDYDVIEKPVINQGQALLGMIDYFKNEILICSTLSLESKHVTVLHEVLHAIFEQLGFDKEHDDEQLIKSLSTCIYLFMKDNKQFIMDIINGED